LNAEIDGGYMSEINRIGKDVWWDHTKRNFVKKRLNLERVPLKFRCSNCGKILLNRQDRCGRPHVSYIREESEVGNLVKYGHTRLIRIETPNPFPDMFVGLKLWGGVCRECWLDGFGTNGKFGKFIAHQLERKIDDQK
jgi:hypothetical protein